MTCNKILSGIAMTVIVAFSVQVSQLVMSMCSNQE